MTTPTRDELLAAVLKIEAAPYDLTGKITRLYGVAMLDYRGPAGDLAWQAMRRLAGDQQTSAIAFLTGFCSAGATPGTAELIRLVPELKTYPATNFLRRRPGPQSSIDQGGLHAKA